MNWVTACSKAQVTLSYTSTAYTIYISYPSTLNILSRFQLVIESKYHALTSGVHVAMYSYNIMRFKWKIVQNIPISAFLPKVCAVTCVRRSGGVVTVPESGMDDVSGGMVVREGGDGY